MRPGRPRCPRRIENEPVISYFKPLGVPLSELEVVRLSLEELEAVRLVDLEDLNQEESAQRMGVSRRALWEDLQNARSKIVEALVRGKAIEIKGGEYSLVGSQRCSCERCKAKRESPTATDEMRECHKCEGEDHQTIHYEEVSKDGRRSGPVRSSAMNDIEGNGKRIGRPRRKPI